LEEESKTTKVELERLNHEINDKEDQHVDEKKKLEANKLELTELKTHNDKFEYNKRKLEAQISDKKSEKKSWD